MLPYGRDDPAKRTGLGTVSVPSALPPTHLAAAALPPRPPSRRGCCNCAAKQPDTTAVSRDASETHTATLWADAAPRSWRGV